MKCTQCGSTKFIERTFLTSGTQFDKYDETEQVLRHELVISGDAYGTFRIIGNCNAYICDECGHIELFAKSFVEKVHEKQRINEENEKRKAAVEAQLEKDYIELNDFVKQLNIQIVKLRKLENDENITVKEQKEVLRKLEWAKQYMPICENIIASWNRDKLGSQRSWLYIKAKQEIFK